MKHLGTVNEAADIAVLTDIPNLTVSVTEPSSPAVNDIWIDIS